MCGECRGEKEAPHPLAAIHGRKGKVERFYWREIFKTECTLISQWLEAHGEVVESILDFKERHAQIAREVAAKAKEYWQGQHKKTPKYDLSERTEAATLKKVSLPIVDFEAPYVQLERGEQRIGKWLAPDGRRLALKS